MKKENGFTLIEVLVVVSILGVLMGLVSVLVMRSSSHQNKMQTKQLVETYLPNSIERYRTEFRRLPPMSVKELNGIKDFKALAISDGNATNESIEVLLVALRRPDFSAKLGDSDLPVSEPFANLDDDTWNGAPAGGSGSDVAANEIVDSWGNPIVYIHKNSYGQTVTIINGKGESVDVVALQKADGPYYNATKYQIISVGENGVQELSEFDLSDDIVNFKREGE